MFLSRVRLHGAYWDNCYQANLVPSPTRDNQNRASFNIFRLAKRYAKMTCHNLARARGKLQSTRGGVVIYSICKIPYLPRIVVVCRKRCCKNAQHLSITLVVNFYRDIDHFISNLTYRCGQKKMPVYGKKNVACLTVGSFRWNLLIKIKIGTSLNHHFYHCL